MTIEIIPSIDIRDGRCVRLYQGDYSREIVYDDDPLAVAHRWESFGAARLHIVDLDAARTGSPANVELVMAIASAVKMAVQVGGGIRDEAIAGRYIDGGVARVVLGTAAVRDPGLVERLARKAVDTVIVGLDARDGVVRTDGWTESGGVTAIDLARQMTALGVQRFLYTDIARDATLNEPNYAALRELASNTAARVMASGGMARVDQIPRLVECGAEAVIIGRALYTGDIDLAEALRIAADLTPSPSPTGGGE